MFIFIEKFVVCLARLKYYYVISGTWWNNDALHGPMLHNYIKFSLKGQCQKIFYPFFHDFNHMLQYLWMWFQFCGDICMCKNLNGIIKTTVSSVFFRYVSNLKRQFYEISDTVFGGKNGGNCYKKLLDRGTYCPSVNIARQNGSAT